jgi:cobalt/nickel transport system permease protein
VRLKLRWLGAVVAALMISLPLGLIAGGTAWGEWSAGELRASLGYVPTGFARFGGLWGGLMPHYGWPGVESGPWAVVAYLGSGAAGVVLLAAAAWLLVRVYRRRSLSS